MAAFMVSTKVWLFVLIINNLRTTSLCNYEIFNSTTCKKVPDWGIGV